MKITLTPETEALVREKVADGRFASADAVVEAAVKLLDNRDRYACLRSLILEAEEEILSGEVVEWTPALHLQWRAETESRSHEEVSFDPQVCP